QKDYDLVIIDGTPSLSKLVSTIIVLGDIVLIPIRPSGLDIWATEKFIEKYDQAKALKDEVKAFFILNEYNPRISLNQSIKEALAELEIDTMKSTLRHRIAYEEVVVMGMGAYEYKDKKAKKEVTALANEVLKHIQVN
ncbi:MAG: AAA family ATPase, partial [Bacteroidota bacterium]